MIVDNGDSCFFHHDHLLKDGLSPSHQLALAGTKASQYVMRFCCDALTATA